MPCFSYFFRATSPVGNSSYQVDLAYILNYVRLVHAEITRGDGNTEKGI